jgi:Bifunctional DNA primase/polymerase, N-terminal
MTDGMLRQALAYAARGWPVFPCLPGQKIPATRHGFRDATTDEQQITEWFGRGQRWNLAIATGTPGPDVLDIDQHGQAGNGYAAYSRLRRAGLVNGAAAYVRTPAGGSPVLNLQLHRTRKRECTTRCSRSLPPLVERGPRDARAEPNRPRLTGTTWATSPDPVG